MGFAANRKMFSTVAVLVLLIHTAVWAQDARLTRITVSNTRDDLLLYFTLEGAFTQKLQEAILSGVSSTFTFNVSLHRNRAWWFDKSIADLKLTHTIKYDSLQKTFTVRRSWKESDPAVTKSFEQAQRWMTEVDNLRVYPLKKLEKGLQYQIRVMAEISKLTLPLYLHYVLFSLWDVETDWYTIDFVF